MAATTALPPHAKPPRLQPLRALRLLLAVLRNPDDTEKVFEFFESVGGDDGPKHFAEFCAEPGTARLLAERPLLVEVLANEPYLASLPEGSLGQWYLRFMRSRGFAPASLLEARDRGAKNRVISDAEHEWYYDRINVMHDLWHVLTGYGTDELGEAALIAFSQGQIPNRSFPLLLLGAAIKGPKSWDLAWPRYLWRAYRRGKRARRLFAAPWEELLPLPVTVVRERLGVAPSSLCHREGIRSGKLGAAVAS